jgi:flagellar hook-associated protein 3 FlgL
MSVTSISQLQQIVQNITSLQNQSNTLEQEISTGLKSQSYSGIAPQAEQLVDLNALNSQQQGYINTINSVNTQLSTMNLATSTMAGLVTQFAGELETNAYNTTGATIQSQAQTLLSQIGDYLNTSDGEGYVFSGSATSTPPYDPSGLPNPGDLTTQVNGAPPNGYYAGNSDIASAQIDSNLNVQYGVTAANPAFEQVIRVLNFIANSPGFNQDNSTDVANINTAQQMLTTAGTQIEQITSQIGLNQSELNSELQVQQQSQSMVQGNISNITQANSATVIAQLDTLQTQLEASYQTVNILQGLSLANYIK